MGWLKLECVGGRHSTAMEGLHSFVPHLFCKPGTPLWARQLTAFPLGRPAVWQGCFLELLLSILWCPINSWQCLFVVLELPCEAHVRSEVGLELHSWAQLFLKASWASVAAPVTRSLCV